MKQVQIPEELMVALVKYHLLEVDDPEVVDTIHRHLQDKLDKMAKRQEYIESLKK